MAAMNNIQEEVHRYTSYLYGELNLRLLLEYGIPVFPGDRILWVENIEVSSGAHPTSKSASSCKNGVSPKGQGEIRYL